MSPQSTIAIGQSERDGQVCFDVIHGVRVEDPFRWLEDRHSEPTIQWLASQAQEARRYLDALPGYAALLAQASLMLEAETLEGLLLSRKATFFLRRAPHDDQADLWMEARGGSQRLLVSAQQLDPTGRTSLEILAVSRNERVLALGRRDGCRNEYTVAFVDVESGNILPDQLPAAEYRGIVPAPDGSGVYYAAPYDGTWQVAWHAFGSVGQDGTVFVPEGLGPLKLGVSLAQDGEYLLVLIARRGPPRMMDVHVLPVQGSQQPRVLLHDTDSFCGGVTFERDFYFLTREQASRRKVMRAPLGGDKCAQVVIPESDEVIRRIARTRDKLLLVTSAEGSERILLYDWNGQHSQTIEAANIGKVVHIATHPQRHDFYFAIESWNRPRTIYHYSSSTRAAVQWWQRAAPIDPDSLTLKQCTCTARDGERIPLYLVGTKAAAIADARTETAAVEQPAPTLLIAYGGYGISIVPTLSLRTALWLAGGGQLAVAGVRGGGERGSQWHEAGAREYRQTAINDLLDAADWLVAHERVANNRLALAGASHAGTLVAAAMTERPERFVAVICTMALLDLIRFESSPYGRWSAQEVGTTTDESQFRALLSYSPYHHVQDGVAYPAVLFISGDADTLIDPFHIRKMAARLQKATTSGRPILVSYDEHRGHRGQLPLADRARSLADQISFLRTQTGAG
jgi:prolyl oligopeptidase